MPLVPRTRHGAVSRGTNVRGDAARALAKLPLASGRGAPLLRLAMGEVQVRGAGAGTLLLTSSPSHIFKTLVEAQRI